MKISVKAKKIVPNQEKVATEISTIGGKTIDQTYKAKELRQHIYDTPDTYAGSIEPSTEEMWVYNEETDKIEYKTITFIEAFYKIFDEILVNAIDHHHRISSKLKEDGGGVLRQVKNIKVDLDRETGWITVENDGDGIEIAKHPENNLYVPEMLMGDLLTSINYDQTAEKTVGGKNGYGAKITNILSKQFVVETVDPHRKLKFYQEYSDNMKIKSAPQVNSYSRVPFTRIKYLPDYHRFGITDISKMDDWNLLARRVYDAAACTESTCAVTLNGKKVATKSFEDYVNLYIGNKKETKRVYCKPHDRWEVVVCLSPNGEFRQISFVNGIFTDRDKTKQVEHVVTNLASRIASKINEGTSKGSVEITPAVVKKHIWIFVKSTIVNPSFDTQTKRCLTTLVKNFGSRFFPADTKNPDKKTQETLLILDDFIKKASKLGIAERSIELAAFNARSKLSKNTDGKRAAKIHHAKLIDAPAAAGRESEKAILVLTEGDSAAKFFSGGIKGLPMNERKYWGCFPLRGKLLNVKKATFAQLSKNEEIMNIKKIVGLVEGKDYSKDIKSLRYGKIMILSDADRDGDHIKGLIMNFIQTYWPSLAKRNDFICSFATPIVKVWEDRLGENPPPEKTTKFYSEAAYRQWAKTHPKGWTHKYYKGLGTHTAPEARECFKNKMVTNYTWDTEIIEVGDKKHERSSFAIDLAFNSKLEDHRKQWLTDFCENPTEEPPYDVDKEDITDFINKRMILYSLADNKRSIPCVYDGLKPSQRKAIYTFLKKRYKRQIKVVQLTGAMLEEAAYHHGEASANSTIIKLAQDYVGVGNINLFYPAGQFGSRAMKGNDPAAPRYIFVGSTPYLHILFNEYDNKLLKRMEDDGKLVEPEWYIPTIPLVLANGSDGIGTGWSSDIPCYNPEDIVANLKRKINGDDLLEMTPWYRGYNGTITKVAENKYITLGSWRRIAKNKIRIDELPVGDKKCKSFVDYKTFIYELLEPEKKTKTKGKSGADSDTKSTKSARSLDEQSIIDVDIVEDTLTKLGLDLTFKEGVLDRELADNKDYKFEKKLKLAVSFSTTNMHLFWNGKIKKYSSATEIIDDFYEQRLEFYDRRKKYILNDLNHKLSINNAKYRFITEIMNESINIYKKKKAEIISILNGTAKTGAASPAYPMYSAKANQIYPDDDDEESASADDRVASYEYLLKMRIDSFSEEKLEKLRKEIENIETAIADLEAKTIQNLWLEDLESFLDAYRKDMISWRERNALDDVVAKKVTITKNKKAVLLQDDLDDDNSSVMTHVSELEKPKVKIDKKVINLKKSLTIIKKKD